MEGKMEKCIVCIHNSDELQSARRYHTPHTYCIGIAVIGEMVRHNYAAKFHIDDVIW